MHHHTDNTPRWPGSTGDASSYREAVRATDESRDRLLLAVDGVVAQCDRILERPEPIDVLAYVHLLTEAHPEYAPELGQISTAVAALVASAESAQARLKGFTRLLDASGCCNAAAASVRDAAELLAAIALCKGGRQ